MGYVTSTWNSTLGCAPADIALFVQSFIVERHGTDIDEALATLQPWKDNIYVIQQLIQNDVSSTKIRLFLRREMSVRYLIPPPVIKYIEQHHLYKEDNALSSRSNDKGKKPEKMTISS